MQRDVPDAPAPVSSLIVRPASYVDPLDLKSLFPEAKPLELELGSGDGGFLCAWAGLHPERDFLGVERLLGRLRKIDRKGRRAGLANLRLVRIEAGYFLKYLVPAAALAALHVYFPDPWPKRRHQKNRLVNPEFVRSAARALRAGASLHVRTDNQPYFEQMRDLVSALPEFEETGTPEELSGVLTDFEREFVARGLVTLRASWHRR